MKIKISHNQITRTREVTTWKQFEPYPEDIDYSSYLLKKREVICVWESTRITYKIFGLIIKIIRNKKLPISK